MSSFAVHLRELRERAGLTQQELADRAGLTTHAVSALERGTRTRPYPHTVRALAAALDASEAERAALLAAVPRRGSVRLAAATVPEPIGVVVPDTPLFGRDADVQHLLGLVDSGARLVTLTGPGGVGKTRLAAAAADALAASYPDGTHLISLAPLADAGAVPGLVARAIGLSGTDGDAVFDALVGHLAGQCRLLVLDNFEHLLSAAAFVARLVAASPGLTVLVTSRSPLRVRGEQEFAVAPLSLPPAGAGTAVELQQSAAGALVLERCRVLAPGTALTGPDLTACVELCHRLAGLPLAIELATAQLRLLPPTALLDRLDQALATAGSRDLPERQRTMKATLDWSYGLLDEEERRLFTLLGAFRGGGTLEAVERVAAEADEFADAQVLPVLARLVEHSLVMVRAGRDGGQRFDLLEPVAQYARSLLAGDRAGRVLRAHAAFFLAFMEEAAAGYERQDQVEWLARTDAEEANVLAAVERSLDLEDDARAALLTWSMWLYWWLRGQFAVGRRLAERCVERDGMPDAVRTRARLAAACMAYAGGDQPSAAAHWEAADALAVGLDDADVRAKARAGTGLASLAAGDVPAAAQRFTEALDISRQDPDGAGSWITSLVHVWLGTMRLLQGQPSAAVADIERGLSVSRYRGDRLTTYVALYNLAQAALALGDVARARRHVQEGIALSGETRDLANLAYFVETLAVVEARSGRPERVGHLLGTSSALRQKVGADIYGYYLPDEALRASAEDTARRALGGAGYEESHARGRALAADEVLDLVRSSGTVAATSDFR